MADQVAVLESIRDVLSGKGDDTVDAGDKKSNSQAAAMPETPDEDDEEILDLTKMVNDDGSITELDAENAENIETEKTEETQETESEESDMADKDAKAVTEAAKGDDVLDEIDKLLADDDADAEAKPEETGVAFESPEEPKAEEKSEEIDADDLDAMFDTPEPAPAEEPAAEAAPEATPEPITDDSVELELSDASAETTVKADENLASEESVDKAKSAIEGLIKVTGKDEEAAKPTTPSPSFRNGETVEDLVMESLKPMLSKWLDENLPSLVEEIVQKEISRIIPK